MGKEEETLMNTVKTRSDAWTHEHDSILVANILSYVRQGKTQLEAFHATAIDIGRTSKACGFRWNATLRYENIDGLKLARQGRTEEEGYVRSKRQRPSTIDFSSSYPRAVELFCSEPIWVRYHNEGLVTKVEVLTKSPTPEQVMSGGYAILGDSSLTIDLSK